MEIFTEIYSFRLNVVQDTNVVQDKNVAQDTNVVWDNLLCNFWGEQIEFITKICIC